MHISFQQVNHLIFMYPSLQRAYITNAFADLFDWIVLKLILLFQMYASYILAFISIFSFIKLATEVYFHTNSFWLNIKV